MEERKQKTNGSCPREDRLEAEVIEGAQTYMEMTEGRLAEVQIDEKHLMELILSPYNMNRAYRKVISNGGSGGVDSMEAKDLLPYLKLHNDELRNSILNGKYKPMPVRRVEIPKDNGKTRKLGIPTLVDRVIQQSIAQVLTPMYEPQFSEGSYGFRPNRSAQGAMVNGVYQPTTEGTPQGGPLSPLLSNIVLNELDKELERRGHPFVRYADDSLIFCKSKRGAERVCESLTKFIEKKLFRRPVRAQLRLSPSYRPFRCGC